MEDLYWFFVTVGLAKSPQEVAKQQLEELSRQVFKAIDERNLAELTRLKLIHGQKYNTVRRKGNLFTPLMYAVEQNAPEVVVRHLLEQGLSKSQGTRVIGMGIRINPDTGRNETYVRFEPIDIEDPEVDHALFFSADQLREVLYPLRIAVRNRNMDILRILDEFGQPYTDKQTLVVYDVLRMEGGEDVLEFLFEATDDGEGDKRFPLNRLLMTNWQGAAITPVCYAVSNSSLNKLSILCDMGADINMKGETEYSDSAVFSAIHRGYIDRLRELLEGGNIIDFTQTIRSYNRDTGNYDTLTVLEYAQRKVDTAAAGGDREDAERILELLLETQENQENDGDLGLADNSAVLNAAARARFFQNHEACVKYVNEQFEQIDKIYNAIPAAQKPVATLTRLPEEVSENKNPENAISLPKDEELVNGQEVIVLHNNRTSRSHIFHEENIKAWSIVRLEMGSRMVGIFNTEFTSRADGTIIPGTIQKMKLRIVDPPESTNPKGAKRSKTANRGGGNRRTARKNVRKFRN